MIISTSMKMRSIRQFTVKGIAYLQYKTLIDDFVDMTSNTIDDKLVGIYLHGSLAMGCFNPEKSDIDLIVVIDNDMPDIQKLAFMRQVVNLNEQAPAKGLEISVVKKEYCNPFVYPTPFELHFSPMHLQWFIDNPKHYVTNMHGEDKDLAAHFTIIKHYGIVLCGDTVDSVFGLVPKEYF